MSCGPRRGDGDREPRRRGEPLLDPGGDDRARFARLRDPGRAINQRPLYAHGRERAPGVNIRRFEMPRDMHSNPRKLVAPSAVPAKDVNEVVFESREPKVAGSSEAAERCPVLRKHGCPLPLAHVERSIMQNNARPAADLPPARGHPRPHGIVVEAVLAKLPAGCDTILRVTKPVETAAIVQ